MQTEGIRNENELRVQLQSQNGYSSYQMVFW